MRIAHCRLLLLAVLIPASSLQLSAAAARQQPAAPTIEELRAKAQERMRQDRLTYSDEEFRDIETTYQDANKDLRDPSAKGTLEQLVRKYPKSNRSGCAVLYLAQISTSGSEREKYLKSAIANHADAWYGDGVQVGAFARAQLASLYARDDRLAEARTLAEEVRTLFPGAVDHGGVPLVDTLRRMKLLQ